jgi:hypothetical protein
LRRLVIVADADLRDPPEAIAPMLVRWREGYQVLFGRRTERSFDPLSKRLFAWAYYRILSAQRWRTAHFTARPEE